MRLVDDVCQLVELNPVPWEGVLLDRQDVAFRCSERSLVAVSARCTTLWPRHVVPRPGVAKPGETSTI